MLFDAPKTDPIAPGLAERLAAVPAGAHHYATAAAHWSAGVAFDEIPPAPFDRASNHGPLRKVATLSRLDTEHAGRLRGRPTIYKPEFCHMLLEAMALGYSVSGFAGWLGVTLATLQDWGRLYPDFSSALSRGKFARLNKWERMAVEVAETGGQGSQATMIIFGLKNMGSDEWKEKQEVQHSGQLSLAALVHSSLKTIERAREAQVPVIEGELASSD